MPRKKNVDFWTRDGSFMKLSRLVAVFAIILQSGCTGLGNAIIGHHPNSYVDTEGDPKVVLRKANQEIQAAGFGSIVIAKLTGVALDQLHQAIEKESKRYKATYSARNSQFLYTTDKEMIVAEFDEIHFERRHADGTALSFTAGVDVTSDGAALRLFPKKFVLNKTKSKVAFASPYPWHWLASAVWWPWYMADPSIAEVDVNIQVSIDAIAVDKDKRTVLTKVGSLDFPMGKSYIGKEVTKNDLSALNTGFIPLPALGDKSGRVGLPVNVTVTVMEANDLGDVIAQGAEQLKSEKASILQRLQKLLGVSE